jgi:hypothetical protein
MLNPTPMSPPVTGERIQSLMMERFEVAWRTAVDVRVRPKKFGCCLLDKDRPELPFCSRLIVSRFVGRRSDTQQNPPEQEQANEMKVESLVLVGILSSTQIGMALRVLSL